ncbi:MAG: hypothetical protein O2822_05270 [Chloroflexi bacterium]|nr:hypothetical protein [Chloroflexota bacterium]
MTEPWQHFYQSQRLRLSYWVWGSAEKPPLLSRPFALVGSLCGGVRG